MILVAGSANLDFVVRAHHIPAPGETVLGQTFTTYPGGKGANQAVACARAGNAITQMLLSLGEDSFAAPLRDSLHTADVRLFEAPAQGQPTGCAFICVADNAENAITVAPGANLCLLPRHLPELAGFSHLLMQLEIPLPTVTAYAQAAHAQGVRVVLNAAPAQQLPAELLEVVDVLIVNEGELTVENARREKEKVKFSATPITDYKAPPVQGEHTERVLGELLGMDAGAIQKLRDKGVI